ncbi:MAG: hypothetical protein KF891_17740 [Rhizobacter sp.]|nr:hypothetical protein [Rhizobacter sp.]
MVPSHVAHRYITLPLMSALSLVAAQAGAQERSPYYIGLRQEFTRDNNVFRTATNPVSETISSTGVVAGIDQPIGRQRVYADATAEVNRYRNLDALDNKSYSLLAGLDWETVEFLSGTLRYSTRNSLADFGTLEGSTAASDQITQQLLATARYGLSSKLSLDAGYEHRRLDYRSDVYAAREYSQNSANAGVRWGTSGLLTVALGYRFTQGSTPHFLATPPFEDEMKRRDVDLTVVWSPTGFSTLNARVSATKETHTVAASAEVSGVTGAVSWNYRPTAKLQMTASLSRDTGTETTFLTGTSTPGSTPLLVDNNRLSTAGQIDLRYAMTSKITLNGNALQSKGTVPGGVGDDKVTRYGVGLGYTPTRNTSLGCNVTRENRDTSGVTAYSATTTGCSAQITFR